MKECNCRFACNCDKYSRQRQGIKVKEISFSLEGLKEYYKSIKDRDDISDAYKLKIANDIIEW